MSYYNLSDAYHIHYINYFIGHWQIFQSTIAAESEEEQNKHKSKAVQRIK